MFQSTHPRGVRLSSNGNVCTDTSSFNPRTRVGCDLSRTVSSTRDLVVSIHAPAWGATAGPGTRTVSSSVSIHAPAWGATSGLRRILLNPRVSIHAPAWGATKSGGLTMWHIITFQSTHPRGVRPPCSGAVSDAHGRFNPRTRVGCDWRQWHPSSVARSFNPRTRVGCDDSLVAGVAGLIQFQSTHPRGVRHQWKNSY